MGSLLPLREHVFHRYLLGSLNAEMFENLRSRISVSVQNVGEIRSRYANLFSVFTYRLLPLRFEDNRIELVVV